MVNDIILNYFKQHRAEHSLGDLKEKALDSGYSKEDVDEALAVLKKGIDKTAAPKIQAEGTGKIKKSGRKWMKIAGILGFVFLGLMVLSGILSLFSGYNIYPSFGLFASIIVLAIAFFLLCSVFVYLYGFFKLGQHTDSKLIRISSALSMAVIGLWVVLSVLVVVIVGFMVANTASLTGNVVAEVGDFDAMGGFELEGASLVIMIVFVIFYIFFLVLGYMFSIGLIEIKDKVRFAKIAGIFGLGVSVLNTITFFFVLYMLFNPMILLSIAMGGFSFMLIGYNIISFLLGFFMMLFSSLVLLDASKKYE